MRPHQAIATKLVGEQFLEACSLLATEMSSVGVTLEGSGGCTVVGDMAPTIPQESAHWASAVCNREMSGPRRIIAARWTSADQSVVSRAAVVHVEDEAEGARRRIVIRLPVVVALDGLIHGFPRAFLLALESCQPSGRARP